MGKWRNSYRMLCPYFSRSGFTIVLCAALQEGHCRSANSSTMREEAGFPAGGLELSAERPSLLTQAVSATRIKREEGRSLCIVMRGYLPEKFLANCATMILHEPLPQVPPPELCRRHRAGPHRDDPGTCRNARPACACVPLLRSARNREDLHGAHSCEDSPHPVDRRGDASETYSPECG